jgi:hypothetical protein
LLQHWDRRIVAARVYFLPDEGVIWMTGIPEAIYVDVVEFMAADRNEK